MLSALRTLAVLESEVEGEGLATRYILEQACRNGDDLATLKTRFDPARSTGWTAFDAKLEALDRKVDGLGRNLPRTVGEAVREALRERDGR